MVSASVLLLVPIAFVVMPETRAFKVHARGRAAAAGALASWNKKLRRQSRAACLAQYLATMAATASMFWVFYFPVQKLGMTVAEMTVIIISAGLMGLVGFPLSSRMVNAFGRRMRQRLSGLVFVVGSAIFYLVPTPGMPLASLVLGAGFLIMSVSENALLLSVRTWTTELFPTRVRAGVQGALGLSGALGAVSSKFILALLLSTGWTDLPHGIVLLVMIMIPALMVFATLPETWGTDLAKNLEN
jgi:MFS family permease